MGLHDGHRMRKKQQYLRWGLNSMADHEVLELLLFYAVPRRDVNDTAHRLLQHFGTLEQVFNAPVEELQRVEGVGQSAALLLHLVPDALLRAQQSGGGEQILSTVEDCGAYLLRLLGDAREERLYQLCLDAKGKLLCCLLLSGGDIDSAGLSVRQVVNNALQYHASSVVLGHNHPSGVALPSQDDRAVTLRVQEALRALDIRLMDHIVVADGDYVSMAQSGYLDGKE